MVLGFVVALMSFCPLCKLREANSLAHGLVNTSLSEVGKCLSLQPALRVGSVTRTAWNGTVLIPPRRVVVPDPRATVPGAVCSLNSAQAVVEAGLLNELLIVVKLSYGLGCCAAEPSYDPA